MEQENSNSAITFTDFEGTVVSASAQRSSGWCSVLLNSMPEGVTRISGVFPKGIVPFSSHVKGSGIVVDKGKYGRQMEVDPMTVKLSVSSEAPVPFEGHVVAVSRQRSNGWLSLKLDTGQSVAGVFPFKPEPGRLVTGAGLLMKGGPHDGCIRVMECRKGETIRQSDGTDRIEMEDRYLNAVKNYISHYFSGIGEYIATDIVKAFGEKTFEVMEKEPERLLEISHVTGSTLDKMKAFMGTPEWTQHRDALVWMNQYDIPFFVAKKVCDMYGENTRLVVKDNPYILPDEVKGIGFQTADQIALSMGMDKDSPYRVACGIKACLSAAAYQGHYPASILEKLGVDDLPAWVHSLGGGHTRLDENELVNMAASKLYLDVDPSVVKKVLHGDINGVGIQYVREKDPVTGVERTKPYVGLSEFQIAEVSIAKDLVRLMKGYSPSEYDLEEPVPEGLDAEQVEAVKKARESGVFVLTGLPGTGKTHVVKDIVSSFADEDVALVAPTGRAAQRLTEMTGFPASTVHRALECMPDGEGGFKFLVNRSCLMDKLLVVIDETSMMDTLLLKNLLAAVPTGARVIMVGDGNQLPSVAPGKVLQDIVASGLVPSVNLTKVKRQSGDGATDIVRCAAAVNAGDGERVRAMLAPLPEPVAGKQTKGIFFVPAASQGENVEKVHDLVGKTIPDMGYRKKDIQVLCPKKSSLSGSRFMNDVLHDVVNPDGATVAKRSTVDFREGDRVMQTRNDYDRLVFNGETGVVTNHMETDDGGVMEVSFGDRNDIYDKDSLSDLFLAYALTIHKSQGNQYPATIIALHDTNGIMLRRPLLYTAMTRAEGLCVIVGSESALQQAVKVTEHRNTGLCDRIRAQMKKASLALAPEPVRSVTPPPPAPAPPPPEVAVSWQDMKLLEGYGVTPEALQELAATGRTHFVGLTSYRPSTPESPVAPALRIIKTNCFLVNVDGKVQVENARGKSYGGIREYFSENQTRRCASTSKKKTCPAPETHTHKLK